MGEEKREGERYFNFLSVTLGYPGLLRTVVQRQREGGGEGGCLGGGWGAGGGLECVLYGREFQHVARSFQSLSSLTNSTPSP